MFRRLVGVYRGEGAPPWISFVTILGVIALVLSMLTFLPSQAIAQEEESEPPSASETEDLESPSGDDAVGEGGDISENEADESLDTLNGVLENLNQGLGTQKFNADIDVEITEIVAEGPNNDLEIGDTVTISGEWDASNIDEQDGTTFWVTLPSKLKLSQDLLTSDYEALSKDGVDYGFTYDVAGQPGSGDWEVDAEVVEEIDSSTLNFRTSADEERDVSVEIPVTTSETSKQKMSRVAPRAAGEIAVTVDRILNSPIVDPTTQLTVGEKARVEGIWDATGLDLEGGETFSVGFPDELSISAGFSWNMYSDGSGEIDAGEVIGQCVVAADNTFTCELNDAVAGKDNVKGTWWIEAKATTYTTEESVQFDLPGGEVIVELPGDGGGIDDGTGPLTTAKNGRILDDRKSIEWTVDIAGPLLVALDEDGDASVELEDNLSELLDVCRPNQMKLLAGRPGNQVEAGTLTIEGDTNPLNVIIDADEAFRSDYLYTLKYVTCTADGGLLSQGDGEDGEYTNTIEIDGEVYGEGIGPGEPWEPSKLHKGGYLLGGQDRWQKASWNIVENGANLRDLEKITLEDDFGANQKVCEGGLSITVHEQDHLPSWNDETGEWNRPSTNISNQFNDIANVADAGATGFSTTITWDEDFEFAEDKYYTFSYSNCLTTDGVPDPNTEFKNSAVFNGAELTGTAKSPGVSEDKWGWLNKESKNVAGEEQSAGTTLDWTVRVDGQKLETQDTLEITDTFSDTLAVCEVSGKSLKESLNFKLEARDFVNNGGLETVDLTDATDVALSGNTLTFTLDKEAFGEPHFSREYSYFITYTLCTSSGGLDAAGTTYSNELEATGNAIKREVRQDWNGGADGNGVSRGSFSLLKQAANDSKPFGEDLEFTVQVEEFAPVRDADGNLAPADLSDSATAPTETYNVVVKADGTPVSGHYMRGNNWQIRLTEIGFPVDSGFVFEPGRFRASDNVTVNEDGTEAIVKIVPRSNVNVELRNKATLGSASITKIVDGPEADAAEGQSFQVTARITRPSGETTVQNITLQDGDTSALSDLPVGTKIVFSETKPANSDDVTWGEPVFTPSNEVTITNETPHINVRLTNSADTTFGTFSLYKQVKVDDRVPESAQIPTEFDVVASWSVDGEAFTEELKLNSDGTVVESEHTDIPAGTVVTLEEILPPAAGGAQWETPVFGAPAQGIEGNKATFVIGLDPVSIGIQNVALPHYGSLSLVKKVEGPASEDVAEDQKFQVNATITTPGGDVENRTFYIEQGKPNTLNNLIVGTTVALEEVKPADNDDVTWGQPVFTPSNEITITTENLHVDVELTNNAEDTYGTFSLSKEVTGPEQNNDNVPEFFQVRAEWVDTEGANQEKILEVPTDGSVDFGEDLKNGTIVTLTEIVPEDGNGIAWGVPAFSGQVIVADGNHAEVVIGKDPKSATVKNYADTNTGTLRITKAVEGEAAEAVPADAEFTVKATWQDGGVFEERTLTVKQGETTELGEELPVNTVITFSEMDLPEIDVVNWGEITWATDPSGESWLKRNPDGSYSGIISDDPAEGRLITLSNEALWSAGAISYEKYIVTGAEGEPVPATDADLPEGAEFEVVIDNIELPEGKELPDDAGISVGDVITLNAENNFYWESEMVLPKGTKVTFSELDPAPLPGISWGEQSYYVVVDATDESGERNVVEIEANEIGEAQIHNRAVPTTEVIVEKIITGPKGSAVTNDEDAYFQVTASWTDVDGVHRSCVLNVVPGQAATIHPEAEKCNAPVIDGKVQFPTNTEITFEETGATTSVSNAKWSEVIWTIAGGAAELTEVEGSETAAIIELTGESDEPVSLELENKTSANGLIILPIPIFPFPGGSSENPNGPAPEGPSDVEASHPSEPGSPEEGVDSKGPGPKDAAAPSQPSKPEGGALANTGANVLWIAGAGLLLLLGGAWIAMRGRNNKEEI